MRIEWPPSFRRTPSRERDSSPNFRVSLAGAVGDLEDELRRLNPAEWRVSFGNSHAKSNGMPLHNANPDDPGFVLYWSHEGDDYAVACDASPHLRDNVRHVYYWLRETRKRNDRPVVTGEHSYAAARLPPADTPVATDGAPAFPYARQVLGVGPDAGADDIREAFREQMKRHHPDTPGPSDEQQFERAKEARDILLDADG